MNNDSQNAEGNEQSSGQSENASTPSISLITTPQLTQSLAVQGGTVQAADIAALNSAASNYLALNHVRNLNWVRIMWTTYIGKQNGN